MQTFTTDCAFPQNTNIRITFLNADDYRLLQMGTPSPSMRPVLIQAADLNKSRERTKIHTEACVCAKEVKLLTGGLIFGNQILPHS